MKLSIFTYVLLILLLSAISYADVPDSDQDGVADEDDKCPDSGTNVVDQFGCSCSQCVSDDNPCTDDCSSDSIGRAVCNFINNDKQCQGGYCANGICVQVTGDDNNQISNNGMSPSGIIQSTEDPTYVTLRWPAFADATHYNVRLDDGTSERYDDIRFETCYNSPHYYCENGIKETFIDSVPVKPGRNYAYWVDPIIPGREYFNVNTQFSVTNDQVRSSPTQGRNIGVGSSSDIVGGDFIITSLASVSQSENQGRQSIIVIVTSIGDRQPPVDAETARKVVFENEFGTVNDYYIKNSYGKVLLIGRVVGAYSLSSNVCNLDEIVNAAVQAADRDVNFKDYSRIIIFAPATDCVSHDGYGSVGNRVEDINTNDGQIKTSVSWNFVNAMEVAAHELGHNFGLGHANLLQCLTCQSIEYGDTYSIMGGRNARHLSAAHKETAGWLSNTITVDQGEYILKPLEENQPLGEVQQIKLPTASGKYYSLDFRQPIEYDREMPSSAYSGVFIHFQRENEIITNLVNYNFDRTPLLQVDRPFRDPQNNYDIILKRVDAQGALVSIEPYGTYVSPIEIISPNGGESWEAGSTQTIIWKSSNMPQEQIINGRLISEDKSEIYPLPAMPNDGSEQITIPPWASKGSYRMEIETSFNNQTLFDESDNSFSIENFCEDSDGGINYDIKGRTTNIRGELLFEDRCLKDEQEPAPGKKNILFETYCNKNDQSQVKAYDCPNGCSDGACLTNPITSNVISGRVVENNPLTNLGMIEIEGELEVIHMDDFDNPENSKYIHYIIINGKKYEIKSENSLPVVMSGTKVKVKGLIIDGNFYLENYINAHPEINALKENSAMPKTEMKSKKQLGFFNSDWIYILAPAMVIITFLVFLEAYRIKNK